MLFFFFLPYFHLFPAGLIWCTERGKEHWGNRIKQQGNTTAQILTVPKWLCERLEAWKGAWAKHWVSMLWSFGHKCKDKDRKAFADFSAPQCITPCMYRKLAAVRIPSPSPADRQLLPACSRLGWCLHRCWDLGVGAKKRRQQAEWIMIK